MLSWFEWGLIKKLKCLKRDYMTYVYFSQVKQLVWSWIWARYLYPWPTR